MASTSTALHCESVAPPEISNNCKIVSASGEGNSLNSSATRTVYLVTYSQANLSTFPRRSDFSQAVVESFTQGSAEVVHWCCSLENHSDNGQHYHMALKLNKVQRWLPSKRYLQERFGVSVHYSNVHHNYYSAWRYVTKSDTDYEESDGHPDLQNTPNPRTSKASMEKRKSTAETSEGPTKKACPRKSKTKGKAAKRVKPVPKKKRLTPYLVSDLIVTKNIKTRTDLYALAQEQKEQGKTDLVEFILNRSTKSISDLLATTWEMKTAKAKIARSKKSRMELLEEASKADCVAGCNGLWLECAKQTLEKNGVDVQAFGEAIKEALTKGRGKHRNLMIVGPANCGKTFILKPLTLLYQSFCNPASGSFAWVGVQDAECIFLNDFRWSPQLIPWHDLLLMLEGEIVHLPAPKTHFSQDIELTKDTPIFCTSKRPLIFIKNGVVDDRETDMMAVRWKIISFSHQISAECQQHIPPCGRCFTSLVCH